MGLWSRYKSHSQCLSHSLLKLLVTAASRSWKKPIRHCNLSFPEHCGEHTDLTQGRGEHEGSLSRADPRHEGREEGAAEQLPMPLQSGGMSTCFTGITEDQFTEQLLLKGQKGKNQRVCNWGTPLPILWLYESCRQGRKAHPHRAEDVPAHCRTVRLPDL